MLSRAAFLLSLVGSLPVFACKCDPLTTAQAWEKAVAVFSGQVIGVEDDPKSATLRVELEVSDAWKGVSDKRVKVLTRRDQAACGYSFKQGNRYLVFAGGEQDLEVTTCGKTVPIEVAQPDLKQIQKTLLAGTEPAEGNPGLYGDFYRKEMAQILQVVLDDERLAKLFVPPKKPLIVRTNTVTAQVKSLKKFGVPVRFKKPAKKPDGAMEFSDVTFEKDVAKVRFSYAPQAAQGEATLKKDSDGWKVQGVEFAAPPAPSTAQ